MRRGVICLILALSFLCVGAEAAADGPADVSGLIRLHVVAAGDGEADQRLKLAVRDACLAFARDLLAKAEDAETAFRALEAHREDFRRTAERVLRERGCGEAVAVRTGVFPFPDRLYGDLIVPAGDYRALRVTIGSGEGHNWWCVLYPSLCLLDESVYASGQTDVEIHFYSSIFRWVRSIFHNGEDEA